MHHSSTLTMRKLVYFSTLFALPHVALSVLPFGITCPKFLASVLPPSVHCSLCEQTAKLDGIVSDCACGYDTVNAATVSYFHPLLEKLQKTSFFRHFKVHLDTKCKFWDDGGHMCFAEGCMVKTCEADEIPAPWLKDDEEHKVDKAISTQEEEEQDNPFGCEQDFLNKIHAVLRDTDDDMGTWSETEDDRDVWIEQDETADMVYVDLLKNPEKFTGYVGQSTWKIWKAIYEENCFEEAGQCIEKRVFYRLISGFQTSITTHVASTFYYPPTKAGGEGHWGPNTQMVNCKYVYIYVCTT
jgi:ERO1-like protein alpha